MTSNPADRGLAGNTHALPLTDAEKAQQARLEPQVDDSALDAYWRNRYTREVYHDSSHDYDDYAPAYRAGYQGYGKHGGDRFEDAEAALKADYERIRGDSKLAWEDAKRAVRAAWDHMRAGGRDSDRG